MIVNSLLIIRVKSFILLLSVFIFIGCGSDKRNVEAETYFIKKVQLEMKNSTKLETDFTNLVPFEWEKVCFDDALFMRLTFTNKETKNFLDLSEKFAINEGYIKGSPVKEMYINHKVINHNCWEKGTVFIISTFKNINNKYRVIVKEEGK